MVLLGLLAAPQLRASAPAMQMGPGGRTYSGLGRIPRPVPSGSNGGRGRWGEYSGQAYRASRNSDLRRARRGEFGGPRGGPPFFGPEAYGPYGMPPPFGGGPYPAPGPYPWGGAFPTDAEYQGGPYPARVEGQPEPASQGWTQAEVAEAARLRAEAAKAAVEAAEEVAQKAEQEAAAAAAAAVAEEEDAKAREEEGARLRQQAAGARQLDSLITAELTT
uniref:Uncharacterized protein n=1 Tax=Emiliania huxleyi TaxID=2903 RepID=A0A7S3RVX0_EMIHU